MLPNGRRALAPVFVFFLLLTGISAAQTTIHVPTDQATIQGAIAAAHDGDTVLVAPGTYSEHLDFLGKKITVQSSGGAAITTIDGGSNGTVVVFHTGETTASILQGFTITNGTAIWNNNFQEAGGIAIVSASPTILNNVITNNQGCDGDGIYVDFGAPVIKNNVISNNRQTTCSGGNGGGGIALLGAPLPASAQIVGNTITGNSNWAFGGGISMNGGGSPLIQNNIISKNSSSQGGGIAMYNGTTPQIIQNLITDNTGGGVRWLAPCCSNFFVVANNTIANNDAADGSALWASGWDSAATVVNNLLIAKAGQNAVYCDTTYDPGPPTMSYNDVYSNGGTTYAGSCSDLTGTNHNISIDPSLADVAAADYSLDGSSPVVDAGDNTQSSLPSTDLNGDPRLVDGKNGGTVVVDLGAYEYQGPTTMTVTPPSLSFAEQKVGTSSASQPVTVTNTGQRLLHLKAPGLGADFQETDSCQGPQGIAPGKSCDLNVVFAPVSAGVHQESISVVGSNVAEAPVAVTLNGSGGQPVVNLSSTSLSFADQPLFTTSNVQTITVTNVGDANLVVSSVSITGNFQQSNSCSTVTPTSSCGIAVTFTPTATRQRSGLLTITDDAAGSPHTVMLSGNGTGPEITFSSPSLNFLPQSVGTLSNPLTLTVTNTGGADLVISGMQLSGDFSGTTDCPGTLIPNASCHWNISFQPALYGARLGAVTFTDNAAASPQQVALSGQGTAPLIFVYGAVPTAIVGAAPAQGAFTVTNVGNEALIVSSVGVSGGDFTQTNTCNQPILPLGFCQVTVTFTPTGAGTQTGQLTIASNAAGSPLNTSFTATALAGYPVPVINRLGGFGAQVGTPTVDLHITGTGFWPATTAAWDGTPLPTVLFPTGDLVATLDASLFTSMGEHQITVSNPSPGGRASNSMRFLVYEALQLSARDLIYDPFRRVLYASIAAGAANHPATVVSIDPATGNVTELVSPGSEPSRLAISDDGQFLYIGLDKLNCIKRFNLYSGSFELTIPLGSSYFLGQYAAADILVLPGSPHSIAVALAVWGISPPNQQLTIFDNAVPRPNSSNRDYPASLAIVSDPTILYAASGGVSPSTLDELKVDASGLTLLQSNFGAPVATLSSNGILLFSYLNTIDPNTLNTLGHFSPTTLLGSVASVYAERGTNLVYLLEENSPNGAIWAGDATAYTIRDHLTIPFANYPYTNLSRILRWGSDGLAYKSYSESPNTGGAASTDQVIIMRSAITNPSNSSNPVPVISSFVPSALNTSSTNLVLAVKGSNFVPGAVVRWNGSDRTTTYVDAATLSAYIGAADLASAGTVSITVANPTPGGGESAASQLAITVPIAPIASLSASSLNFGAQAVGTTSAAQMITITNNGTQTLSVTSADLTGDFKQSNNCGSVAPGTSCTVTVTFAPTTAGDQSGTLTLHHNATPGTSTIALTGQGTDFVLAPPSGTSTSASITAGQSATFNLSISGSPGFSGTVTLTCNGAPSLATCTINPTNLTISGSAASNFTVTLSTSKRGAGFRTWTMPSPPNSWLLAMLLLMMTGVLLAGRRRRLALAVLALALMPACGGGGGQAETPTPTPGTPAGTYPIVVSATAGSVTKTITLNVTVQ